MNGKVRFIEIYWFPPKDYNEIADFLKDINSSKKIMNIDKEIIC
jgi:hypothetical protein